MAGPGVRPQVAIGPSFCMIFFSCHFPLHEFFVSFFPCLAVSLCVESSGRMFGRFQGVVEMGRFYPVDTVE